MLMRDQNMFLSRAAIALRAAFSTAFSAALCVALAGLIPTKVMAAPIGLMERFALAEDRGAILAELIPGSDDYFFYHC